MMYVRFARLRYVLCFFALGARCRVGVLTNARFGHPDDLARREKALADPQYIHRLEAAFHFYQLDSDEIAAPRKFEMPLS